MKNTSRTILLSFLGLIAIAGALYYGWSYTAAVAGAQGVDLLNSSSDAADITIVNQVSQLSAISLDTSIFQSAAFQSLLDYSIPVTPEPISRPNPFAPIGQN